MTDRSDIDAVVAALKKSGFPLQTRVEHEIRVRAGRGWKFRASEHPWRNEFGDQFIDVIANCGMVVLVVECKKAQERSLLFLRPLGGGMTGQVTGSTVWQHPSPSPGVAIGDIDLEPSSYLARFCVSADKGKSSQRLLERDAWDVVSAVDVFASQLRQMWRLDRSVFLPTIVTTASLYTLRYKETEIPLETGSYETLDPRAIETIPWIRFHKTFTTSPGSVDRTVFVVNATALPDFLDAISRSQGFGPPSL